MAHDPNVIANHVRQDVKGMWMYRIVRRHVEWTYLMMMFILSGNTNKMCKKKYGLWKEVSHKILETVARRFGGIYRGPKGIQLWAYAHVVVPKCCVSRSFWAYQLTVQPSQVPP